MTFNKTTSKPEYLIEILNACERRITISVPADTVKQVQETYIGELASKRMDGYRPGAVQTKRFVAKVYKDNIEAHTQEKLIQSSFEECLKKEKLTPVSQPVFTDLNTEPEHRFRYTATFEVYPSIPCPKLTDVMLEKWEASIMEEEIDQVLSSIQSPLATEEDQNKATTDNTQLRLQARQWMESRLQNMQREQLKKQLIDILLEQNPISELPPKLVEQHYLQLKKSKAHEHTSSTKAESDTETKSEVEAHDLRALAKRQVMLSILFEAVATEEKIQLDIERVNASMGEIAAAFQNQPVLLENMRHDKNFINFLCSQVLEEQIIDRLLEQITLVKKPSTYTELMKLYSNQENHTQNLVSQKV